MNYCRWILPNVCVCVLLPPSKSSFGVVGVKDRCAYFSCPFCYLLDKSRKKHTSWWHSRLYSSRTFGEFFLSVCGQLFSYWSKNSTSYYFSTVFENGPKKSHFELLSFVRHFLMFLNTVILFVLKNEPKNSFLLRDIFFIFLNTVIHFTINSKASINHEIFKALF